MNKVSGEEKYSLAKVPSLGELAFEAYIKKWNESPATTSVVVPDVWEDASPEIKEAWEAAAMVVATTLTRSDHWEASANLIKVSQMYIARLKKSNEDLRGLLTQATDAMKKYGKKEEE